MSDTFAETEREALRLIKPTPKEEEKLRALAKSVIEELEKFGEREGIEMRITVEGSFAKGTWLKNDPELDIFLILPPKYDKAFIKLELYPRLREWLSGYGPIEQYSEHPYLSLLIHGVKIDIVPAIQHAPESRVITAVDRTHLHTEYVLKRADERLKDEIRLSKAFAKGVGVYGAEIRVRGFSGYLLELLTIYYGSFRKLLEAAAYEWIPRRVYIDIEGLLDERKAREMFGSAPMIVIDPTDSRRNAAAALSIERMSEFIMASRLYLINPRLEFFFPRELHPMEKRRIMGLAEQLFENVVLIRLRMTRRLPPDTLWGELHRAASLAREILEDNEFEVYRCEAWSNERDLSLIACLLSSPIRPRHRLIEGPPIKEREHTINFIDRYLHSPFAGPWVNGDRLYAMSLRPHMLATSVLKGRLGEILVSDLSDFSADVSLLSWSLDVLESEEARDWILGFILGKPRWLWALLDYRKT